MNIKQIFSFGLVLLGVTLEYFDLMLVSLFSTAIASHFFGIEDQLTSVTYGFFGFGLSFFIRPIGAIIFGILGDTYGRKCALLASVSLMSCSTLVLGLSPAWDQVGYFSGLLFVICRIGQGLAVGGEYGIAMTFAYECSTRFKTSLGSCVISATHIGGLLAAILARYYIDHFQQAFCVAGLIGLACLLFRVQLGSMKPKEKVKPSKILKKSILNKTTLMQSFAITASTVFIFYAMLIFINEVLASEYQLSRMEIFEFNILILSCWIFIPVFIGFLIDFYKLSFLKVMLLGAFSLTVFAPLILIFSMEQGASLAMLRGVFLIHLLHMVYSCSGPRYLGDLFNTKCRATGVSATYALGSSITAGMTPILCQTTCRYFGSFKILGPLIGAAGFSACVAIIFTLNHQSKGVGLDLH